MTMHTRQSARFAAAEEASASAHQVLFSPDLSLELWPWLDGGSKAALRGVSSAMRRLVDGLIEVVASPASGFSPDALSKALLLWPRTTHLTLLNVGGAADLAPLATTTAALARLTSLTVRQAPRADAYKTRHWDIGPATLSSTVAATLTVIDLSGCINLRSIAVVRNCAQLRCLWMSRCMSVPDLSPLGACSETLEQLWMAGDGQVRSLAPLKACLKLRKLDLRGCLSALNAQVQDLQLLCTQLAAPSCVELEGLVHDPQPSLPPSMQAGAALALGMMIYNAGCTPLESRGAIAAAGAIPALVQLLAPAMRADVKAAAVLALNCLAANHTENQTAISAAGAIPSLVKLLDPDSAE
ncbi:hypothetical protein FOA52_016118 [Chlamydomonas sp. UWO 241]|nr:hypothetical protein FOA52_016118 [Chlamydomonas sp. UWO 241]